MLRRGAAAAAARRWLSTASSTAVPREAVDAVVIGAGVVGLAVARGLAMAGREVIVLDSASSFGTGTSARNSEVIHAGIYYTPGSFKAMLCIRGRDLLYKYCEDRGVPHERIGKLIVATSFAEVPELEKLFHNGRENGVNDLKLMEGSEAMAMEPEMKCVKAILSPSTGIVDSHTFMLSLLAEAENHGAAFSYNNVVLGGKVNNSGLELQIHASGTQELKSHDTDYPLHPNLVLEPKLVINSAGLSAVPLAKRFSGLSQEFVPSAYYARGSYFKLSGTKTPFSRLIYPMPDVGCVGVHVTLDLNGQVRFGPDFEWIEGVNDTACFLDRFDYRVDPERCSLFYSDIRKYYPNLKEDALVPDYSGIRPKLSGPGQTPIDFLIQGEEIHGVSGLINLFGVESPGLTASLAIAEHIVTRYAK